VSESEIREFTLSLLEFVKRAAGKDATPAEVEALAAVAKVLAMLFDN